MECAGTRRGLVRFRVLWVLLVSQSRPALCMMDREQGPAWTGCL